MSWVGIQHWMTPTFFHWPVPYDTLRDLVPEPFELGTFNGQAWVSVVPFQATATYPRFGAELLSLGPLWQLNIRTYIHFNNKPSIYFLKVYTDSNVSRIGARTLLSLPFYAAQFDSFSSKKNVSCLMTLPNKVENTKFTMDVTPSSDLYYPEKDSLAYWLTERYDFYSIKGKRIIEASIDHTPWKLQDADYKINHHHLSDLIPEKKHHLFI